MSSIDWVEYIYLIQHLYSSLHSAMFSYVGNPASPTVGTVANTRDMYSYGGSCELSEISYLVESIHCQS